MAERPDLTEFLAREAAEPFAWGSHDCVRFAARWAAELTGLDVPAMIPPAPADEGACRAALAEHGGLVAATDRVLTNAGLFRAYFPWEPGDIAVITCGPATALAIRTCGGWVGRSQSGLMRARDGRVLAAWRAVE